MLLSPLDDIHQSFQLVPTDLKMVIVDILSNTNDATLSMKNCKRIKQLNTASFMRARLALVLLIVLLVSSI